MSDDIEGTCELCPLNFGVRSLYWAANDTVSRTACSMWARPTRSVLFKLDHAERSCSSYWGKTEATTSSRKYGIKSRGVRRSTLRPGISYSSISIPAMPIRPRPRPGSKSTSTSMSLSGLKGSQDRIRKRGAKGEPDAARADLLKRHANVNQIAGRPFGFVFIRVHSRPSCLVFIHAGVKFR